MDLIHPHTKHDVADAVREAATQRNAAARGRRPDPHGPREPASRSTPSCGPRCWTRSSRTTRPRCSPWSRRGCASASSQAVLAEGGQEWPVDAPDDATVGGVIAAGVSSFRRLRVGHVRDTVVEMELVRGDGRLVKSGARTVKNVTGFDVHRLADRLARHPRRDRAGRAEGAPAAAGPPDAHDRGRRPGARSPAARDRPAARGRASPSPAGCACGWRAGPDEVEEQTAAARSGRHRRRRSTIIRRRSTRSASTRRRRRGGGGAVAHRRRGRRPRRLDARSSASGSCGSRSTGTTRTRWTPIRSR